MKQRGRVRYQIEYKIYFRTKNREKIIDEEKLKKLLKEICKEMHIEIIKGRIEEDGIKLELNCPPNLSISEIVKKIKGKTSRTLEKEDQNF